MNTRVLITSAPLTQRKTMSKKQSIIFEDEDGFHVSLDAPSGLDDAKRLAREVSNYHRRVTNLAITNSKGEVIWEPPIGAARKKK